MEKHLSQSSHVKDKTKSTFFEKQYLRKTIQKISTESVAQRRRGTRGSRIMPQPT